MRLAPTSQTGTKGRSMSDRVDACKYCLFYEEVGDHGGKCVRYPPTVPVVTNANGDSDFINETPYVGTYQWCGEFKRKVE